jgi:hypothetical protein
MVERGISAEANLLAGYAGAKITRHHESSILSPGTTCLASLMVERGISAEANLLAGYAGAKITRHHESSILSPGTTSPMMNAEYRMRN